MSGFALSLSLAVPLWPLSRLGGRLVSTIEFVKRKSVAHCIYNHRAQITHTRHNININTFKYKTKQIKAFNLSIQSIKLSI